MKKNNPLKAAILSTAFILPTISFSSDCVDDVKESYGAPPLQVIIASKLMRQDIDPNNHRMRHHCDKLATYFLCPLSGKDGHILDTQVVNKLVVHFSEGLMDALAHYKNPVERMVFVRSAAQRDLDDVEGYREACVRLSDTFMLTGEKRSLIFSTLLKSKFSLPELISFGRVASDYSSCFLWTKTTSHLPLLNFVRDFHQEENKVLFARTKGMHAAEKQAFFRRICTYLQISPDAPPEGVTARDKYAESFLRVVKPLFDRRVWRMEDGLVELKRLASVPIEERERAFAEVSQSLVYLHADRLSLNFERPYWDRALDLRAGARQAYLTQADEVIKTVGTNMVSHIRELVQVIYDVTPEKRVLIQEYTQRIAAEFQSLNTRRNLVMALVYCGWKNAEECEVFVNAAFTLIRAFDEAKVPLASAYKILRDLRKCSDAYTDPSFVPDLLPVFLTAKETHSAQLMEDLKGVDSASRQQVSRLVAEALKDSDGNVGRLELLIKALKKIASPEEREEIMKIASPFFAEMRLARAYAEVIEAIANVEREKREEFVARLAETKKGRTMPWAIKLALSDMRSAKRERGEQAVSVGANSSSSSTSSSSSDESDDEGTTSLKKARRN